MLALDPNLSTQLFWLFVLAVPVACVAWTVTHEELFAEGHDWCVRQSQRRPVVRAQILLRVHLRMYCFSHYVAAGAIALTGFRLLLPGWRGALIAWLAVVWVANVYMSLFVRLRLNIKRERVEIEGELRDPESRK